MVIFKYESTKKCCCYYKLIYPEVFKLFKIITSCRMKVTNKNYYPQYHIYDSV